MKECQICKSCFPDDVVNCPTDETPTFHSIPGGPVLEGKYQLEKRLGQGGMGVVYKAQHKYLKTAHAVKVILPDLVGNDPQLVTRFRQEALAAAAIRHQNVVAVTDYGTVQEKIPFLVMEYVEGESLHDLLARERRLSPQNALELISAICAGVGAAHRQGIVHRDLKPLNVMIQKGRPISESVKILDFGLAKIKSGELLGSFIQAQTTGLMGSPYYMAPEQWSDEDPDAGSDVYSLGVMLFQMLTGDVPFKGSSIPAIMKKHLSDPPPAFSEVGLQTSPEIEKAVRHTLEKDKDSRTPSVEKMVEELRFAVFGHSGKSRQPPAKKEPEAATSVQIFTNPPQSNVFIDNVEVGQTHQNGWLMLEGLRSGNHQIRVTRPGFYESMRNISCDGKPQKVTIELQSVSQAAIPAAETSQFLQSTPNNLAQHTQTGVLQNSIDQQRDAAMLQSVAPKSGVSAYLLVFIGIFGLLLLSGIGVGAAYLMGFFGSSRPAVANGNPANPPSDKPAGLLKQTGGAMVKIPGGKFKMGNNSGQPQEQPEHEVEVKNFSMDKTEVTNLEYSKFVSETGHKPPAHWTNGKLAAGEEELPVVRVSIEDVLKFAEWRSKRDGASYRLPTEEEWEYAARNGAAGDNFPWGDKWEEGKAVLEQSGLRNVGSAPGGKNRWGIEDLIGNVWEWTSSEIKPYPGSKADPAKLKKGDHVIRGGGFVSKAVGDKAVSSTSRLWVEANRQDAFLGFRLVKSED